MNYLSRIEDYQNTEMSLEDKIDNNFSFVNQRLDEIQRDVAKTTEMNEMNNEMNKKYDCMDKRFNRLNKRFDKLEKLIQEKL